jgi:hypothetical protein
MSVNDFYQSVFSKNVAYDGESTKPESEYLSAVMSCYMLAYGKYEAINKKLSDSSDIHCTSEAEAAEAWRFFKEHTKGLREQGWEIPRITMDEKMIESRYKVGFEEPEDRLDDLYHSGNDKGILTETVGGKKLTYSYLDYKGYPVLLNPKQGYAIFTYVTTDSMRIAGRKAFGTMSLPFIIFWNNRTVAFNAFTGKLFKLESCGRTSAIPFAKFLYDAVPTTKKSTLIERYSKVADECLDCVLSEMYGFPVAMNNIEEYIRIRMYFGNLMEAFLRYAVNCPWLIRTMTDGLRWGKPCKQKSIKAFFGVNQNDLNKFLAQPDEKQMMFYLLARAESGMSVTEAERLYQKVLKINTKYRLDDEYNVWYELHSVAVKGPRGRTIMQTTALPKYLSFYIKKKLNKWISIPKYTRYLLDEKKKNPNVMLRTMEQDLEDFNRMSHEILPDYDKFVLPYNIVHAHETMCANYNTIVHDAGGSDTMDSEDNFVKLERLYHDNLYEYDDPKFVVLRPIMPSDIYREGTVLCHCVGSYTGSVLAGQTRILFMRKKSKPSEPYVTFELRDGMITQQYGSHDRQTTPEECDFIERWFVHYQKNLEEWKQKGCPVVKSKKYEEYLAKLREQKKHIQEELSNIKTLDVSAAAAI